jgi:hypothetical protein
MKMDSPGMTIRDWFAGQALNAIIPKPRTVEEFESIPEFSTAFAKMAYEIADAMIKAREENDVSKTA